MEKKNIFQLAVKLVIKPSESLRAVIEQRPLIPVIVIFLLTRLIYFFLPAIFSLIAGIRPIPSAALFLDEKYIKIMLFALFTPFLASFLINFFSRKIYRTDNKLITFLVCFLFINAVVMVGIILVDILSYTFVGHLRDFSQIRLFIAMIPVSWAIILTIAAIVAVYGLRGRQAISVSALSVIIWLIIRAIYRAIFFM